MFYLVCNMWLLFSLYSCYSVCNRLFFSSATLLFSLYKVYVVSIWLFSLYKVAVQSVMLLLFSLHDCCLVCLWWLFSLSMVGLLVQRLCCLVCPWLPFSPYMVAAQSSMLLPSVHPHVCCLVCPWLLFSLYMVAVQSV